VQAISIAGAKMSQGDKPKELKGWLATLQTWGTDTALESRVRFKIQDLLDQVKMDWHARREQNTVRKTEDIRKQAHAELGMIQTAVPDFLPGLNISTVVAAPVKEVCLLLCVCRGNNLSLVSGPCLAGNSGSFAKCWIVGDHEYAGMHDLRDEPQARYSNIHDVFDI
jgi:hypothetical protein